MYGGFDLLQYLDVEFADGAGTVFGRGVDFLYVQFDGAGAGFFEVGGEALPTAVVVAVDAGDNGYRYGLAGFPYEGEVFLYLVGFDDVLEVVVCFGVVAVGAVEQMLALGGELLFKERFQYDGTHARFFESDDFFDTVGQSRTGCDDRILQFQSCILGL